MKTYKFVMRIEGSAEGTINANSKEEARKKLEEGLWDDIDIDVENIIEIEHVTVKRSKK